MVVDGYGRSEIACPHLSSHSRQQQREKGSGSQEQEQEQGHQHREEEEQGEGHHQREKGSGSEEQEKKHEQQQQKEEEQGQGHHQREKGSGSEEQEKEHGQQPQQEEEEHEQQQGQEQEHESGQIQGLTANLYPNDVQVILAGHPVALRATEDLRVLLFRINVGRNDERIFLAGARNNAINQLGREAKDFTFSSSFEVDRLMEKQDELFFVKTDRESHGQQSKQRESGGHQREEREKGRDFALHWVSRYFV